ncbi:MAG TPA: hypothetical protein VGX76_22380 [Pirellulales bacterium]|nr:hypothetical protein [Pirellulales bacterium]
MPPAPSINCPTTALEAGTWQLERRSDGAVLVRVRSRNDSGPRLPDAVFAFRNGDPQFLYWDERLRALEIDRQD